MLRSLNHPAPRRTAGLLAAVLVCGCGFALLAHGQDGPRERRQNAESSEHRDGPRRDRERSANLTEEEFTELLEVLRDLRPDWAERIERARENNPQRAEMALRRQYPMLQRLLTLREHDPELYELRIDDIRLHMQSYRLAVGYRMAVNAGEDERAETIYAELQETVEQHSQVRLRAREREIERMQEQVESMRERVEEQREQLDETIRIRLDELTDPATPLRPRDAFEDLHGGVEHEGGPGMERREGPRDGQRPRSRDD